MLIGHQRRANRIGSRAPGLYVGNVSSRVERVEDRTLLSGSDNFAGRTNLGSVISTTDTGTNVGFSGEPGEITQSGTINSAWWSWTAPSNGTLVVDTNGSSFDTFLTLATGSAVNALNPVAQDDDGGDGLQSLITASVTSGVEYQIAVDGFNTDTGSITLNLAFVSFGTEDFGDAPTAAQSGFASSYPTLLADNGAQHTPLAGFTIGSEIDTEADGQPSAAANLDDTGGTPNDEDGVNFIGTPTLGSPGSVAVFVTNTAGVTNPHLDVWIDFDRDGDWDEVNEHIFTGAAVAGTNTVNFTVPGTASPGLTFARFRLYDGTTPLAVTGLVANGEVEDHSLSIVTAGTWQSQGPSPTINAQLDVPPDDQVGGAIQAIAPHPTDSDILYIGAVNGGIWKTTNATAANPNWTPLTDGLPSLSIGAISFDPTDGTNQTLLAGTGRWSNFGLRGDDEVGLYYSTNGGSTWTHFNNSILQNETFSAVAARGTTMLAASADNSLFRSTTGGGSWTDISGTNGLASGPVYDLVGDPGNSNRLYAAVGGSAGGIFRTDDAGATWTSVNSGITGVGSSTNYMRLAIHNNAGNNVVYAAIVNSGVLNGVFRSANQGSLWTAMDVPAIHPGAQGRPNTSLAADPTDPNIVFIGGDRPSTNVMRGDASLASGSQFATVTAGNANNSTPHADTRHMIFDADGNLLESDDGGIYRLTTPNVPATRIWGSVNGNLQVMEVHDVSYDPLTNIIMTGTQDNGTHIQLSSGSLVWERINGGDGGDVAIDSVTLAGSGHSYRYLSSQNLGGFRRLEYDSANNFIASVSIDTSTITDAQFVTPIELNAIDPSRMLFGGVSNLYESTNITAASPTITNIGGAGANRNAMVYGGTSASVPNADLVYVGVGNQVYKRTTSGGAITATSALPSGASTIVDVAIDSSEWMTVFAIDSNQIFMSVNAGSNWTDITGNLTSVSSTDFRTIEFVPGATEDSIVVGTRSGVFQAHVSNPSSWVMVGLGLPDVLVFDLEYDPTDDLLVAATLGRGVWTFPNASAVLGGAPPTAEDFGDAPSLAQSGFANSYPVTLADDGARHAATGPTLGTERDSEADGVPSANADADDITGGTDDEDGVTFATTLIASSLGVATGSVSVNLQNPDALSNQLDAWIDFNRDGIWSPSEQIFTNFSLGTT
ncbi:MAG: hypothetical protein KDB01_13235, partial [Planctomycetaceae bacterium]|nr:hypothetical protein [Planctomycetaceae bacterium]